MDKILVIGASGHAKVIIEAIELNNEFEVMGYIDTFIPKGKEIFGYQVLGNEEILKDLYNNGITKGIIAIGDNWTRYLMYKKVKELCPSFEFITVIHPTAIISKYAKIGKGTVVLTLGKINTDSIVGDFCILNTNSNLGHDSVMGDFSSLASSVTMGGTTKVGKYSAISLGACVIQNITIGKHTVIGAGSVITQDIDDYNVAYGIPAKIVRKRKKEDKYLKKSTSRFFFEVRKIRDENELKIYKQTLLELKNPNPFYKTELLDTTDMTKNELSYFVLKSNGKAIIVMPFYIRPILILKKKTEYCDVTSPYGYSGPLFDIKEVHLQIVDYFWKKVDEWYIENNIISEFVRFSLNDNHVGYTGILNPTLRNVKGVVINEKEQWKGYKPKVRNNYRKALQEGLTIKIFQKPISIDVIKDFYDIHIQTMQRNNASSQYFYYIDYFKNFILENPDSAIIAMVYKESIPISTELILKSENTLFSYLGGTLSYYFFTRPNDFLKIEVINWARENNYKYYILGGGLENGDGLYKYKKSFFSNDEDSIYYTGRKILNQEVYNELVSKKNHNIANSDIEDDKIKFFPLYRKKE